MYKAADGRYSIWTMALLSPSPTCELVYDAVRQIQAGKVSTYGDVAKKCGGLNPRVVGNCLHQNPYPMSVPCHRVVNAAGRLAPAFAFGGPERQREILENEGVVFTEKGLVDFERSRY